MTDDIVKELKRLVQESGIVVVMATQPPPLRPRRFAPPRDEPDIVIVDYCDLLRTR